MDKLDIQLVKYIRSKRKEHCFTTNIIKLLNDKIIDALAEAFWEEGIEYVLDSKVYKNKKNVKIWKEKLKELSQWKEK